MSRPEKWVCPGCDTVYVPGFIYDLDVCEACEQDAADQEMRA